MSEPSFLGLSKTQWDFINSFANWAAAIGSFAAAAVALHLANRIARPTAKVTVGHRIVMGTGQEPPYPEFISFRIVNSGDRNFRVTHIGWRTGIFRKRHALQMYEPSMSSPLPTELSHAQEANWLVPMSYSDRKWVEHFAQNFIMQEKGGLITIAQAHVALESLRAVFTTSLGSEFVTKPEDNLLQRLRAACRSTKTPPECHTGEDQKIG
ncbi:hypothetical protein [Methylosinus sp. Ce-a6]|uniref:hypothetical protein n=1 Tax=Methylosinus sp. Ce-a6 TaxID=2172005 RepID=UPI00135898FC|nr:hypothetical protein [Methylosinus sp. Ce-a6]